MELQTGMRIGRVAELVGVSTDVLRVWERRYGLFTPKRSPGGYRLYDETDLERARRVVALRDRGVPVSAAIATVTRGQPVDPVASGTIRALRGELDRAVFAFDDVAFDAVFDRSLAELGIPGTIHDLLLPYLGDLGTAWASGRVTVAQEHFLSQLVRRRLGALASRGRQDGPLAILACPPREHHDIPLLALGVLMSAAGWRVRYLGVDTPVAELELACATIRPDLVILSGTRRTVFDSQTGGLRRLARICPLALGGRGASTAVAVTAGATLLPPHLQEAAEALSDLDAWRRPVQQ